MELVPVCKGATETAVDVAALGAVAMVGMMTIAIQTMPSPTLRRPHCCRSMTEIFPYPAYVTSSKLCQEGVLMGLTYEIPTTTPIAAVSHTAIPNLALRRTAVRQVGAGRDIIEATVEAKLVPISQCCPIGTASTRQS